MDRGYLGRVLQLTLLAPDIVEAILDGRQAPEIGLPRLMEPFPAEWPLQRAVLQGASRGTCPPGVQSTEAPEMRTSSATLGSSAAKKVANAWGVLPTGS